MFSFDELINATTEYWTNYNYLQCHPKYDREPLFNYEDEWLDIGTEDLPEEIIELIELLENYKKVVKRNFNKIVNTYEEVEGEIILI